MLPIFGKPHFAFFRFQSKDVLFPAARISSLFTFFCFAFCITAGSFPILTSRFAASGDDGDAAC